MSNVLCRFRHKKRKAERKIMPRGHPGILAFLEKSTRQVGIIRAIRGRRKAGRLADICQASAKATLKGIAAIRMIKTRSRPRKPDGITGEISFVEALFQSPA